MKSNLCIFITLLLFGCTTTKNVDSQTNYKKVTTSKYIDTTLRMVNPIEAKEFRVQKGKINRIDAKAYTAISYIDSEKGESVLCITPKKDSIDLKVKVKASNTVEERKTDEKITKATINYFDRAIVFIAITLLGVAALLIVKFIHNAINKPSDRKTGNGQNNVH